MMDVIILKLNYEYHFLSIGNVTNPTEESVFRSPIELHDIGYYGIWEQFCDRQLMDKDFAYYPQHELKLLRLVICDRAEQNLINCRMMGPFTAYKYCEIMRTQADYFLEGLLTRFSQEDEEKKSELVFAPNRTIEETPCYTASWKFFNQTCVDEENPYFRMFLPLLARACLAPWLTADHIRTHIEEVCADKNRLTRDIEWSEIAASINCRE